MAANNKVAATSSRVNAALRDNQEQPAGRPFRGDGVRCTETQTLRLPIAPLPGTGSPPPADTLWQDLVALVVVLAVLVATLPPLFARGLELLDLVGLADMSRERASNLAYGQQRLLEIARALATGPELLLLDEPAAGMNANETTALAKLVRRLRDEPVPAGELADSQSFLTGSMPLRLETNEGIANTLLDIERHDLGFDYLLRYPDLVNAVTVPDVQEMARKYLDPDLYALAVAGPDSE